MSVDRSRWLWLPPFVVGGSAAVAGEVAVALLLYSGGGFLRALTLLLATLLGALALGLWAAPPPGLDRPVEALRGRWLVLLVSFLLAGATAAAWSLAGGLSSGAWVRGLALAFLAAAPLYATGALLGAMASVRSGLRVRGPGAAAAAGATVGAVVTGLLMVRMVAPFVLHLFSIVALSGGALVHGAVLDRLLGGAEAEDEEGALAGETGGAVAGEAAAGDGGGRPTPVPGDEAGAGSPHDGRGRSDGAPGGRPP